MDSKNLTAKRVKENETQIQELKDFIVKVKTGIEAQEAIIAAGEGFLDETPALMARKSELLADQALGTDRSAELVELETALTEAQTAAQEHANMHDVATANHILIGLRAKLDQAVADLAVAESERPVIIGAFLKVQAELIGNEYIEHASKLAQLYTQLRGIDALMSNNNCPGNGITGNYHDESFKVPVFALKAFEGQIHRSHPGQLSCCASLQGNHGAIERSGSYMSSEIESHHGIKL